MKRIIIKSVTKKYGKQQVFNDFSYTFRDNGLYILFGESGCGKTTLLNMLYGLTDYNGIIAIDDEEYNSKVNNSAVLNTMAYISQTTYYVDYLTIYDNLKISAKVEAFDDKLDIYAKQFGVEHLLKQYPIKLSGGEKQRFAIIRALLQDRRIILMDEPTSALDKVNKNNIFELVNSLKKEVLIICATHDKDMLAYADEVVDFKELKQKDEPKSAEADDKNISLVKKDNELSDVNTIVKAEVHNKAKAKNSTLIKAIFKQGFFRRNNKLASLIVCFIFMISLLAIYLTNNYEDKIFSTAVDYYSLNYVRFTANISKTDEVKRLAKEYDAKELLYDEVQTTFGITNDFNSNLNLMIIPMDESSFPFLDSIIYGTYMKNSNEMIVGYNQACTYTGKPEDAIGKKESITFESETIEYTIVGVLEKDNEELQNYTVPIILDNRYEDYCFISSESTNNHLTNHIELINNQLSELNNNSVDNKDDNDNSMNESKEEEMLSVNDVIEYRMYFDAYDDLKAFYNAYSDRTKWSYDIKSRRYSYVSDDIYAYKFSSLMTTYEMWLRDTEKYIAPLIYSLFFISIAFYFQTKNAEIIHKKHIISTYRYYGYSMWGIRAGYIIYFVTEMLVKFLASLTAAVVFYNVFNIINEKIRILPYKAFMFDFNLTIKYGLGLLAFSFVLTLFMMIRIKKNEWFQALKERSDIL